jgi:hypothetical protein
VTRALIIAFIVLFMVGIWIAAGGQTLLGLVVLAVGFGCLLTARLNFPGGLRGR